MRRGIELRRQACPGITMFSGIGGGPPDYRAFAARRRVGAGFSLMPAS
jgi:hypothetical protein